ncbi:Bug family tripartite tricarboxylate transporter substrate binding protein [Variovorax terrae]|uniref:Tripartite tricarboxylate transporter substrate binding protein n=1 Tax=Variovorax terrae TaxID=2923278 RepID=A0A9X2AQ00_9BURK|nr:tripartite tricarboxylate transporter substrate binding protein [Variovorax terrae]MCJ0762606.1 tripartite tricarboxylate transporter substrate binding protein [Variovorax terrae]
MSAMLRRTALAALLAAPLAVRAAPWPARALRILVVYPSGGLSDGIARALADDMAAALGVPVVVENRAGAGGAAGMEALAREAPDGYTLAFSAISPLTLRPHLASARYQPLKDIAPVASIMYTPVLLVGTPAFKGNSFQDLLQEARANPGGLRWASSGQATAGHLVMEQVRIQSGTRITHIPYKGGGQQLNDALSGQFELLSTNMGTAQLGYIRAGRLKPLAVGAPTRLDALPQVPTFTELGFPLANQVSLFGVFAPGATPAEVLDRLNALFNRILAQPAFRQRLLAADNVPAGGTRAAFADEIATQYEINGRIVKAAGIRLE